MAPSPLDLCMNSADGTIRGCAACGFLTLKEYGICNVIHCEQCGVWYPDLPCLAAWRLRPHGGALMRPCLLSGGIGGPETRASRRRKSRCVEGSALARARPLGLSLPAAPRASVTSFAPCRPRRAGPGACGSRVSWRSSRTFSRATPRPLSSSLKETASSSTRSTAGDPEEAA